MVHGLPNPEVFSTSEAGQEKATSQATTDGQDCLPSALPTQKNPSWGSLKQGGTSCEHVRILNLQVTNQLDPRRRVANECRQFLHPHPLRDMGGPKTEKQKQSSTVLHSFISERSVFAIQSGFQLPSSSAQSLDQYCCRFQALCHAHDVEEGMSQDVEPYYHTI